MFISVVLPLPEWPMMATYSPCLTLQADAAQRVDEHLAHLVGLGHAAHVDDRRDAHQPPPARAAPPPPPPREERPAARRPGPRRPAGPPSVPVPELLELDPTDGSVIVMTTCWPALRPLTICARVSPRSPTTTDWVTVSPDLTTLTVASEPVPDEGLRGDRDALGLADDDRGRGAHARLDARIELVEGQRGGVADHAAARRPDGGDRADVCAELDAAERIDRHGGRLADMDLGDVGLAE